MCSFECRTLVDQKRRKDITRTVRYSKTYYEKNKDTTKFKRRNELLTPEQIKVKRVEAVKSAKLISLAKYHLTQEEYDRLLDSQNGVCKICGQVNLNGKASLSIDHDHACCKEAGVSCGECIRGLLCNRCNTVLGLTRDSQILLDRLKSYLQENKRVSLPYRVGYRLCYRSIYS